MWQMADGYMALVTSAGLRIRTVVLCRTYRKGMGRPHRGFLEERGLRLSIH